MGGSDESTLTLGSAVGHDGLRDRVPEVPGGVRRLEPLGGARPRPELAGER
jgi:hypothetical protein